ncbi:MAG: 2-C-methyl-D-erythritol 4-phosphate cytidylyltransferase [Ruminococcaceae bacterium]|nr:2-C-methyl-D-erythritol 4-phosphate cytidylyltransferase [Oscillospiraceae bacterium]
MSISEKIRKITSPIAKIMNNVSGNGSGGHYCSAVVLAAGSGTRMGGVSKQLMEVAGRPVLAYSLEAFQKSEHTNEIIIVAKQDELEFIKEFVDAYGFTKVSKVVPGGSTRMESSMNGFFAVSENCEYVAIHDAARPLILPETIDLLFRRAYINGACAAAKKVADTIKSAGKLNVIESTIPRDKLYAVSTPQLFSASIYRASAAKAMKDEAEVTDDCAMAENAGFPVTLVEIGHPNYKLTVPEDIEAVEAILLYRNGPRLNENDLR